MHYHPIYGRRGLAGRQPVLAVLAFTALLGGCSERQDIAGDHLARLNHAGLTRRVLPHLSVLLEHRACTPVPTPDPATVPSALCDGVPDDPAARRLALQIQVEARKAAHERVDPGAMHADALVDLLWALGDTAQADRVVENLEAVARLAPSADVLGDLSAAYIVRAGVANRAGDLVAAIDAAHRALELDARHAAARFNAALAEQRLALDRVAREDWDAYLAGGARGPWADEGWRPDTLVSSPADTFPLLGSEPAALDSFAAIVPQQARETALDRLMPGWAAAVLAGDEATAEDRLRRAEVIGAALLRRPGGDASVADIAAAVRVSAALSTARAIVSLGAARRALMERRFGEAETALAAAERHAGDVPLLRDWCAYWRGVGQFYRDEGDHGESTFDALARRVDRGRHPALAGRARWSLTTLVGRRGSYAEAIELADSAERLFRTAGETENAAFVHAISSEAAWNLGNADESARRMYRVLHDLRRSRHSTSRHNQLYVAAQAASGAGLRHAAMRLLDDDVAAMQGAHASLRVEPLLRRAEARAALGHRALARADLAAGAPLLDSLPDAHNREWNRQDLRIAEVALDDRPTAATLARIDSVVAFFDDPKRIPRLLPALLTRAQVRLSLGDSRGARADLDSVSRVVAKRSGLTRSVAFRTSMLEARRSVFERLALMLVREGRPTEALLALDRGRAPLGASPAEYAPVLPVPPGTVVASLALVADTLLVWTIGDRVRLAVDTVPGDTLARAVDALAAGLEGGVERAGTGALLARLHGVLVGGMGALPQGTDLVVVADGILARVPFAALRDSATGRYLVEDHAVRYAATLANATEPRPPRSPPERPGLPGRPPLVVAPEFDRARHPALKPLPGADSEALEIKAAYPGAVLLRGQSATPSRVRSALPRAGLVHVAGHAVFDDAHPSRSYLVLAPERRHGVSRADSVEAGNDVLRAEEIETLVLRGVRLVVLSACRTQRSVGRGGGMTGLTAAAMEAGAGGVIGSLWQVEDEQTRTLMTTMHREYRASGDPSGALTRAQRTLLSSPDSTLRSPAAWAGFRYMGR